MRASRAKGFYLITNSAEYGPIPWQKVRYWLADGTIPEDALVRADNEKEVCPAAEFEKLWKIAGRDFVIEDPGFKAASEDIPISKEMNRFIREELGWPYSIDSYNYYRANRLRMELEKIFPDPSRSLLNDPDWPDIWSWDTPYVEEKKWRQEELKPVTEWQLKALRFFGRDKGVTKKMEASFILEEIFSDERNVEAWKGEKDKSPATPAQIKRLQFAARRKGRVVPRDLTKSKASELIDEWYGVDIDLETDYQDWKYKNSDEGRSESRGDDFVITIGLSFVVVIIVLIILLSLFS